MLNSQLSGEVQNCFAAFASFHGINTPTMADVHLPMWSHWVQGWGKLCLSCSIYRGLYGRSLSYPLLERTNYDPVSVIEKRGTQVSVTLGWGWDDPREDTGFLLGPEGCIDITMSAGQEEREGGRNRKAYLRKAWSREIWERQGWVGTR